MPTDVAGGVTDAELNELWWAMHKGKDPMGTLRRFALDQQARGVERALEIIWKGYPLQDDLRALAERLRKGQK